MHFIQHVQQIGIILKYITQQQISPMFIKIPNLNLCFCQKTSITIEMQIVWGEENLTFKEINMTRDSVFLRNYTKFCKNYLQAYKDKIVNYSAKCQIT